PPVRNCARAGTGGLPNVWAPSPPTSSNIWTMRCRLWRRWSKPAHKKPEGRDASRFFFFRMGLLLRSYAEIVHYFLHAGSCLVHVLTELGKVQAPPLVAERFRDPLGKFLGLGEHRRFLVQFLDDRIRCARPGIEDERCTGLEIIAKFAKGGDIGQL